LGQGNQFFLSGQAVQVFASLSELISTEDADGTSPKLLSLPDGVYDRYKDKISFIGITFGLQMDFGYERTGSVKTTSFFFFAASYI